jgi:hypothetical protein
MQTNHRSTSTDRNQIAAVPRRLKMGQSIKGRPPRLAQANERSQQVDLHLTYRTRPSPALVINRIVWPPNRATSLSFYQPYTPRLDLRLVA